MGEHLFTNKYILVMYIGKFAAAIKLINFVSTFRFIKLNNDKILTEQRFWIYHSFRISTNNVTKILLNTTNTTTPIKKLASIANKSLTQTVSHSIYRRLYIRYWKARVTNHTQLSLVFSINAVLLIAQTSSMHIILFYDAIQNALTTHLKLAKVFNWSKFMNCTIKSLRIKDRFLST